MKVVVDVMGADHAPCELVAGAVRAAKDFGVTVLLAGDEGIISGALSQLEYDKNLVEIVHAPDVITMDDVPTRAVKEKKGSSMVAAFLSLAGGRADAMVCAGNTGALLAGAIRYVKRIKGVLRPALAPIIPTKKSVTLLLDAGANTNSRPANLLQWGVMGSIYMANVLKQDGRATVGLLNIGSEETKGDELTRAAYGLLSKEQNIDFIGNVEAREVPEGACDVLVCDGFVGNVLLKFYEGVGKTFMGMLKDIFLKNALTKAAYLMVKGSVSGMKKLMDYSEYGGAPLLGVAGVVIKAHGSSDAKAIYYAIKQAKTFYEKGVIEQIAGKVKGDVADEE